MRVLVYILVTLCGVLLIIGLIGSTLPEQESIQDEVTVRNPPLQVWNTLTQPEHMKQWRDGILTLQPHSRFAPQEGWIERSELGSSTIEVVEWNEPRFLVLETKSTTLPWTARRVIELQEKEGSTRVLMKEVRRTANPYLRLAYRLGFRQSSVRRELSSLKSISEK